MEEPARKKATKNIGLRIPVELNDRLDRLAASTGRSKSYYLIRTLEEHLSDTEYIYGFERDAEAVRRGELKTRPLEELWDELGIEPSDTDEETHCVGQKRWHIEHTSQAEKGLRKLDPSPWQRICKYLDEVTELENP